MLSATKLELELKDSDSNIEKLIDIGFVGQPTKVNINLINSHIKKGEIPVIAPLGVDDEGNSYNINADTAAGFIAGELKASKFADEPELTISPYFLPKILATTLSNFFTFFPSISVKLSFLKTLLTALISFWS